MRQNVSRILILLALMLNAVMAFAGDITTINDTTLKAEQSIVFPNDGPFNLSVKIKFKPNESSFGSPEQLFEILTGNTTFKIAQGIQSIGTFEPSPFIEISRDKASTKISQSDRFIKSGENVTIRITGNGTSGIRFFVNGKAIDLDCTIDIQQLSDVSLTASRDITFQSINFESSCSANRQPLLTLDQIVARLQSSPSAPAGLYASLDRENDPQKAIPGGFYKLAVLPDTITGGYDILYLEGATVNKDQWKTGMLKGKLIPTIFYNHYDLVWYDSNHEIIDSEIFCNIIEGAIMQLNFPLYSTKMRFSRLNGSASSLIQPRLPEL